MQEQKSQEEVIRERKEKLANFLRRKEVWVFGLLLIIVILGVYIRSLPMQIHETGLPGLWDISTNSWTLGPDLDPWLFTRYAKEMIAGTFQEIDMMRNVPLGFDNSMELQMVSYMIVLTYKIVNIFGNYDVNFSAAFMPVWIFALTMIAFFLFVREIFIRKEEDQLKANLIAIISTLFMCTIPTFLSRTIAGIPEKESVGFMFMFAAFYLFLKAWKSEKIKLATIFAVLAGLSTAFMGLTWGGVSYIYVTIAVASLASFILGKIGKKEMIIYGTWILVAFIVTFSFTNRFSLVGYLTSLDSGLAFFNLFLFIVDYLIWNTKIAEYKYFRETKLPKNIVSIIVAIVVGIILISIILGPGIVVEKIKAFNQMMFKPITGRWSMTVAENRQPYFTEWASSFGPYLGSFPVLFWMFFIGSIVIFKKMLSKIKQKDAWILTGLYIFFFCGLVFSRYASHPTLLDGEGFASRLFYYGSALALIGGFIYYYFQYKKENDNSFETIEYEYIFLLALFVLCLFTARSAVRLIMVLGPIAPIFFSSLIVNSVDKFFKTKEESSKLFAGIIMILLVLSGVFVFYSNYKEIKTQAYYSIPSEYNFQWQKAMSWVRNETPTNAVFVHWWDYGYWLQSIGNRATVTDGGNAITYWNYLTGRYLLTGDNQKDALELCYNHKATHLLIDSSDLGKYGAFASIGSDKNMDRYSPGPLTIPSDSKTIVETKDGFSRQYYQPSGTNQVQLYPIEEDIVLNNNGTKVILAQENSAIMAFNLDYTEDNGSVTFKKLTVNLVSNGVRLDPVPVRYVYFEGKMIDFGEGLNATLYLIPRVGQNSIDKMGVALFITPRLMRGLLAQIYLLNDPFGNFKNFKISHIENDLVIQNIINQGVKINEFSYIDGRGLRGPIKIWSIQYTGSEKVKQEYLDKDATKYLDWQL